MRSSILAVVALACLCGSTPGATVAANAVSAGAPRVSLVRVRSVSGVVSPVGTIGPLYLGYATAAAVEVFAGPPDFSGRGTFEVPSKPTFTALGYDCSATKSPLRIDPTAYRPSHTYCRTVYYIDAKTRQLAAFWTSSPSFHTKYGTHPGSSQAYANAHEDGLPEAGCHRGLSRETAVAELLMENQGGHPRMAMKGGVDNVVALVGGHITDFVLESNITAVGLLFC
jgi:hypothetical protein